MMKKWFDKFCGWCENFLPLVLCVIVVLMLVGCLILPLCIILTKLFCGAALR